MPKKNVNIDDYQKYTHALIEMAHPPESALVVVKAMKEIACGVAISDAQRQVARPAEAATCPACQTILEKRSKQRRKAGV